MAGSKRQTSRFPIFPLYVFQVVHQNQTSNDSQTLDMVAKSKIWTEMKSMALTKVYYLSECVWNKLTVIHSHFPLRLQKRKCDIGRCMDTGLMLEIL